MGSITGHKIDYNGAGALRGQRHIPSKTEPKYPPPPPPGLRRSPELRQELKFLQAASKESSLKKIMEGDERLREWSQVVSSAGYFCEVRSLVSHLSPFTESLVEQGPRQMNRGWLFSLPLEEPYVRF